MRYNLRLLLIVLGIGPPLLTWIYLGITATI